MFTEGCEEGGGLGRTSIVLPHASVNDLMRFDRDRFTAVFGDRPRARMLLEASTASEWVARHLESLGHEVIVADPNVAPV
jgi:transposase